ncbi:MAG: hypothetical protein AAF542_26000 [Pseudomonadota bacterium]
MHIILLVVLAISGLVWGIITLQREIRRRQWQKQNTTPLYSLEDPRELAAVLAFGYLKLGGDPTNEQKKTLVGYYQSELSYSSSDANEMYRYASFVIGTDANYASKLRQITSPSIQKTTKDQRSSILSLLSSISTEATNDQRVFYRELEELFNSV